MSDNTENKIVTFDSSKKFKYIKDLGTGGTGETRLFLDESVNFYFAIKKYSPINGNDVDECYVRFIDEIKILFNLFHENVVRVFNYYLYPEHKTGYIQMEYVNGLSIDKINPIDYDKSWNDYFVDVINAFDYLHSNHILHRDIQPSNFMINENGIIKVIDFGFGKKIDIDNKKNSILLNWPASIPPEEVTINGEYNYSTEIYYIGEMFKHLTENDDTFLYKSILKKMLEISPNNRYKTCKEIKEDISNNLLKQINFSDTEKNVYFEFAKCLYNSIVKFTSNPEFIYNAEEIRASLEKVVRISALEKYVQRNQDVISSFVNAGFRYKVSNTITSEVLVNFYKLFINSDLTKKSIIIDSIIARLKNIKIDYPSILDDDLPF